jgi:hypothetical protein
MLKLASPENPGRLFYLIEAFEGFNLPFLHRSVSIFAEGYFYRAAGFGIFIIQFLGYEKAFLAISPFAMSAIVDSTIKNRQSQTSARRRKKRYKYSPNAPPTRG